MTLRSNVTFQKELIRNPFTIFSLLWLLFIFLAFLWPDLLATADPLAGDPTLERAFEGPSSDYWLGTDGGGRDFYSRIIYGARLAVLSIGIAMGIALGVGVPLGLLSGWKDGWVDKSIMWITDVFFSLPILLLSAAVVTIVGPSLVGTAAGIGVALSTRFIRLTRAVTLAEKEEDYVDAARITGLPTSRILRRYILPNLLPSLIVQFTVLAGVVITLGAALSFFGVGAAAQDPNWGMMINIGRNQYRTQGVWQVIPPSVALIATVLAFNLLGDAIRDSLGLGSKSHSLAKKQKNKKADMANKKDTSGALLSLREITVAFPGKDSGETYVLEDISLEVFKGETLGIVGESGSGKSLTVLTALGLTPSPGYIAHGAMFFEGEETTHFRERQWQKRRGSQIGMIFQEPLAVLNPSLTIGRHIMEPLQLHKGLSKRQAREYATELLEEVRVSDPKRRLDQYPHEFSGGMAQRVSIAMAIACEPSLLIADEPTTALDVTVQGQILDLLAELQQRHSMGMIIITHDLGVIAEVADRVHVMYAGQIIETTGVEELFLAPKHPYTQALLRTMPQSRDPNEPLAVIPGMLERPDTWGSTCRFADRCEFVVDDCQQASPDLVAYNGSFARCLRLEELVTVGGSSHNE